MTNTADRTWRSRAADLLWRNRTTKGKAAVAVAAVVLVVVLAGTSSPEEVRPAAPTSTVGAASERPADKARVTTSTSTSTIVASTLPTTTTTTTTTTAPEAPPPPPPPPPPLAGRVARVIDGDTIEMADGSKVRLIGIDTPERGECGYSEAAAELARMVGGKEVRLVPGARDDRDRYGRLLRYVEVDGVDVNLEMIRRGFAIARYDSRDGYGRHPREGAYVAADRSSAHRCGIDGPARSVAAPTTAAPASPAGGGTDPRFGTCKEAKAAGYGPYRRGVDPEYGWYRDADGDGVVCE